MNKNEFNKKIKSAFEENGLSHLIDDQKAEKFMKLSDLLIEKQQGSVPFWKKILASITELQKKKAEKEQK